jgi:asparagine synthase (glutamine-hydrolysing)
MCGIAGLWAPRLSDDERHVRVGAMVDRLAHRGPSGRALWGDDQVALGIARLAIVAPLEPAHLFHDEAGRRHALVNGEIYNHVALREALVARGHEVQTGIDTAVVTHLYEEQGADFPLALDGMFAAAVWDATTRTLVLARDRAGEKPLFVASGDGWFAFASEPGALLTLPWVSREPAPASLARYLVHGFFIGADSAYASVRQLPPAHVMVRREDGERLARYWRPWDTLSEPRAPGDPIALTRDALDQAVRSRTPDEVPFGVFLSGGLDSSLVAALAARAHHESIPTFSLRLEGRGYDESMYARAVARAIGADHHEETLDAAGGAEALETWAAHMDQPLGDPSVLPTWAVARMASRHVPVVLTGEGGDELFGGYPTYLGHAHASRVRAWPAPVREALLALARRMRPRHTHVSIASLAERFLSSAALRPFERHVAWFGTASAGEARGLLAPALRARLSEDDPLAHLDRVAHDLREAPVGDLERDPRLVAYQLFDFETYLTGLLTKVDRSTMAHGLESRAPFLRHALIEYAMRLPAALKLRGTTGKWVLKQLARDLLPREVLTRRKQGFSPPFTVWSRGPLRTAVCGRLSPERIVRAGVLDPAAVTRLLEAHLAGRVERGRTLWTVLSLQMWAEEWVHGGALPAATRARTQEWREG